MFSGMPTIFVKNLSSYLILSLVFLPWDLYAYIDPGSGSIMMQMLFASLLGGLFTIKMYFQKIKNFFIRKKNEEQQEANPANTNLKDNNSS